MQRTAGQRRLDDLLRQERKPERQPDIVHRKQQCVRELKIAGGVRVRPDDCDKGADGHDQVVLRGEPERSRHGFGSR